MKIKAKKQTVYKNARKLYGKLTNIYYNDSNNTTNEEKENVGEKYSPKNLLIEGCISIYPKKDEEKSK